MSNVITMIRRELGAYYTSPIGYIFMMVFVSLSVGLYITTFFAFPVADMRSYFLNLPVVLCVFIPAVTMRTWAEERKENTWELLLTFPMAMWELVIGKFLASVIFFALTLLATVTLPIMLFKLGNPDMGAVISGYFGTLLLGSFFLSIGIFFSGFFKDQIVAFVVTLLACFAIYMVGTPFLESAIEDWVPGLGTLLTELVGLSGHFSAFTRGVIEIADVLYFVAWTAIFLLLNILYVDARSRRGSRLIFAGTVVVCIAIGMACNWLITDTSLGRFDVTEDKVFTVSDASERILGGLDTPVQVKLYITPKSEMPAGLTSLEQDLTDKLDELRVASGGNVQFSVVHLQVENVIAAADQLASGEEDATKSDEEKALEERMLEKGVEPFQVQAMSEDQVTNKLIYAHLGIGYKDHPEEIIPRIMPEMIPELEYRLVSSIYKLTLEKKPVVALVAPKEAVNIPPELRRMYEQMGQTIPETDDPYEYLEQFLIQEKYDVARVELSANEPLPDEYDVLVVVNPRSFNERQRWEINRALVSGKSVVMAVQSYEWEYRATRQGMTLNRREETPQVNELLSAYGMSVDEDILMDVNQVPLRVQTSNDPLASMLGGGMDVTLPMHMLIKNDSMASDTAITGRLSAVFYLWGTALLLDEAKLAENGIDVQTLIHTTDQAWKVDKDTTVDAELFEAPESGTESYPIMVLAKGQFPDAFSEQPRPEWPIAEAGPEGPVPPPEAEVDTAPIVPEPGQFILLGCSEMFRRDFLPSANNVDLFLNSVDAVTLGEDIVNVRGQKPIDRLIDMPEPEVRRRWKLINYGAANSIIAAIGLLMFFIRRYGRNAYTLAQTPERSR